jgi:hypothetical protein
MAARRVDLLRRDLLPEYVETTVTVERGLLLHEFPARLSLVVEQHLKATLAGGVLVGVVRPPELFDAVLPMSAHGFKVASLSIKMTVTLGRFAGVELTHRTD